MPKSKALENFLMRPSGRIFFVRRSREGKSVAAGRESSSRLGWRGLCGAVGRHIARAHGWKLTAGGGWKLMAGGRRLTAGGRRKVEGGRWKQKAGRKAGEGWRLTAGGCERIVVHKGRFCWYFLHLYRIKSIFVCPFRTIC